MKLSDSALPAEFFRLAEGRSCLPGNPRLSLEVLLLVQKHARLLLERLLDLRIEVGGVTCLARHDLRENTDVSAARTLLTSSLLRCRVCQIRLLANSSDISKANKQYKPSNVDLMFAQAL